MVRPWCAADVACFLPPAPSSGNCWSVRQLSHEWLQQDVDAPAAVGKNCLREKEGPPEQNGRPREAKKGIASASSFRSVIFFANLAVFAVFVRVDLGAIVVFVIVHD